MMTVQNSTVRVRFAPSPTGFLHVGGARTAIFNWLFARHHNGAFLVRIEDTDQVRSQQSMIDAIFDSLNWLEIKSDEPPIFQSDRVKNYRKVANQLLQQGLAYRCFCEIPDERSKYNVSCQCVNLDASQREALERENKNSAIRFRIPDGATTYNDLVHGSLTIQHREIEDFVILRSDGLPTYQLAVVVDDIDMKITHIIRGDDHISNTPKQILLYKALGAVVPEFGHVPLILGSDKKRLSKRHGATSVSEYREAGFLPDALFNFLTLLGWSPGADQEFLRKDELIRLFDLNRVNPKSAVFDEQKFQWLNAKYISETDDEALVCHLEPWLKAVDWYPELAAEKRYLQSVIALLKPRIKLLPEFIEAATYFFSDPTEYEDKARAKHWKSNQAIIILQDMKELIAQLEHFETGAIENLIRGYAEEIGISAGKVIHSIRLALTGRGVSPGLFEMMEVLGKETVQRRLQRAIEELKA